LSERRECARGHFGSETRNPPSAGGTRRRRVRRRTRRRVTVGAKCGRVRLVMSIGSAFVVA
jgi:hypothetical protein